MTIQELLELNILELFGLKNLSEDEQKKFLEYAAGLVLDRVVAQLLKELPEEKKQVFLDLFKEGIPDEQKVSFLKENAPDLEAIVFEEIMAFKEEAVKLAGELTHDRLS
ncbi:MAG: hypothetical protein HY001_02480 [Candidatus Portnoybacteria bacterium]|nr:hypothetical protein [Candidatus Portnoybacteria bacterium]